jgi:acetyl esterase
MTSAKNAKRLPPETVQLFPRNFRRKVAAITTVAALVGTAGSVRADSSVEQAAWAAFTRPSQPTATLSYVSPANTQQEVDIYAPAPTPAAKPGKPRPVILFVHGGGWTGGTREALAPHARYFAARGWVCVNVSYRLAGQSGVTIQNSRDDVRAAFDWVKQVAGSRGWDPAHIVALGESAGGQLACALGILPPEPERWRAHSLVLLNPVLDLTTLSWAQTLPGVREAGPIDPKKPGTHPAYEASPLFYLTRQSPRILLMHGRKDTVVPFSQAEALVERARAVNAVVELAPLDNAGHAFFLREYGTLEAIHTELKRIADFLGEP